MTIRRLRQLRAQTRSHLPHDLASHRHVAVARCDGSCDLPGEQAGGAGAARRHPRRRSFPVHAGRRGRMIRYTKTSASSAPRCAPWSKRSAEMLRPSGASRRGRSPTASDDRVSTTTPTSPGSDARPVSPASSKAAAKAPSKPATCACPSPAVPTPASSITTSTTSTAGPRPPSSSASASPVRAVQGPLCRLRCGRGSRGCARRIPGGEGGACRYG
jgi:hypothetical protein